LLLLRQSAAEPQRDVDHRRDLRDRVEEIENPLTRQVRYLDNLVDELAKGRPMAKILRA